MHACTHRRTDKHTTRHTTIQTHLAKDGDAEDSGDAAQGGHEAKRRASLVGREQLRREDVEGIPGSDRHTGEHAREDLSRIIGNQLEQSSERTTVPMVECTAKMKKTLTADTTMERARVRERPIHSTEYAEMMLPVI